LVGIKEETRKGGPVQMNFVDTDDQAFSIAGPRAWNALASDIKLISSRTSFRKKLKTHFFSLL